MGVLRVGQVEPGFAPFRTLEQVCGFVPNLFHAQTLLPQAIEAEAALAHTILLRPGALTRIQKERMMLVLAAANGDVYGVQAHAQVLRALGAAEESIRSATAGDRRPDVALLDFVTKLDARGPSLSSEDYRALLAAGFTTEGVLEAVLTTALSQFWRTLSGALAPEPEFELPEMQPPGQRHAPEPTVPAQPFWTAPPARLPSDSFFLDAYGFVPKMMRQQASLPEAVVAQAEAIAKLVIAEGRLSRKQKETMLLAAASARGSAYGVTLHTEVLKLLGMPATVSGPIAEHFEEATLPEEEKTLLGLVTHLTGLPSEGYRYTERLLEAGIEDSIILETIVTAALANFLITLQFGSGVPPDFEPVRRFRNILHPSAVELRQMVQVDDPDSELVARVRSGETQAFAELVDRHARRIFRTLAAIFGNREEAEDAVQDTFLKAFESLPRFESRSKFSTWLTRIATNNALQMLRERRPMEAIDESPEDESFRPRQLRAWGGHPEQLYSTETRALVEQGVQRLPLKYRMVVVLRDMQQLSTEEAAEALGLGVPALKARLIRGRLMLRESLAAHFSTGAAEVTR